MDGGQGDRSIRSPRRPGTPLLCSLSSSRRGESDITYRGDVSSLPNARGASRYVTPGPLAANKIIVGK